MITDKIGGLLASTCLLHCLVVPFLVAFTPALANFGTHAFHDIIIPITLINTMLSIYICRRQMYNERIIPIAFCASLILIGLGLYHEGFLIMSGFTLLFAHYKNYKKCQSQTCCNTH